MVICFAKLHGLGNDFMVVNSTQISKNDYSLFAKNFCKRRFSVGADGVIFFDKEGLSSEITASMQIFNSNGTEAEVSGNGLRCLAALLIHRGHDSNKSIYINTKAGLKRLQYISSNFPKYSFYQEMGEPILDLKRMGYTPSQAGLTNNHDQIKIGKSNYKIIVSSIGNPHCSLFVDDLNSLDWMSLGKKIESHPGFASRTNVEFIQVKNPKKIEFRFWERGVGQTNFSGTGACAALVASVLAGFTERKVQVESSGGASEVCWNSENNLSLTGAAHLVFEGKYYKEKL